MFLRAKNIILFSLALFSFTSSIYGTQPLAEALQQGKKVAIFNVNDVFTDGDSIQSFIESLILGSQFKDLVTQYFVTDDEVNMDNLPRIIEGIRDKVCFNDESHFPIREHYQTAKINQKSPFGFRTQDAATVLFPLADKLGVHLNLIQGENTTNPISNPYLGNFGVDYEGNDLQYISRIHQETGSKIVIEAMKQERASGKLIYILNGGSLKLLSDIQEREPNLLPDLDVTVMAFRQPMNFPPFTNPNRKWNPSWNEGIDMESTAKFVSFASCANNPQFGAIRIVDSNTVEYSMVCDGKMHPLYKDYMKIVCPLLSKAAYQNLVDAEERHEKWSGFKTKFMDPLIVFNAFGFAPIPHSLGMLKESAQDFCLRPVHEDGFLAFYPNSAGKHPFSCPRANNPGEEHPEYAEQYKRVAELRTNLKAAHASTWEILDQIN